MTNLTKQYFEALEAMEHYNKYMTEGYRQVNRLLCDAWTARAIKLERMLDNSGISYR